jgi:hypothetical protein
MLTLTVGKKEMFCLSIRWKCVRAVELPHFGGYTIVPRNGEDTVMLTATREAIFFPWI